MPQDFQTWQRLLHSTSLLRDGYDKCFNVVCKIWVNCASQFFFGIRLHFCTYPSTRVSKPAGRLP